MGTYFRSFKVQKKTISQHRILYPVKRSFMIETKIRHQVKENQETLLPAHLHYKKKMLRKSFELNENGYQMETQIFRCRRRPVYQKWQISR